MRTVLSMERLWPEKSCGEEEVVLDWWRKEIDVSTQIWRDSCWAPPHPMEGER